MVNILHTEASTGWGGQEIRILREAEGMRTRGHEIYFVTQQGAQLATKACEAGFQVYEVNFRWNSLPITLAYLCSIIRRHDIAVINTHSSMDAWIAGFAGRLTGRSIVRTRHISAPIKKGLNSKLLYRGLADSVVTTCQRMAHVIQYQAKVSPQLCRSIPTGVDPSKMQVSPEARKQFRQKLGLNDSDILAGTLCVLRSWKGLSDLIRAAELLKEVPNLKWLVIGSGPIEDRCKQEAQQLGVSDHIIFTGHLSPPFEALKALDIFLLLSTANEGVSQSSLQAAYLERPLITTRVGGLDEVCIDGKTGLCVDSSSPRQVAVAVKRLLESSEERLAMGRSARQLVENSFTWDQTLIQMENTYQQVLSLA